MRPSKCNKQLVFVTPYFVHFALLNSWSISNIAKIEQKLILLELNLKLIDTLCLSTLRRLRSQQICYQIFLKFQDMISLAINYYLHRKSTHICYLKNLGIFLFSYNIKELSFQRRSIQSTKIATIIEPS